MPRRKSLVTVIRDRFGNRCRTPGRPVAAPVVLSLGRGRPHHDLLRRLCAILAQPRGPMAFGGDLMLTAAGPDGIPVAERRT